ncbi:DUF1540 domain-containing protein [Nocardioides sp. DS6]|uniref:DUF1540 domain-containing protein n=1 Tax=Nocardioides eburneus TaxID=3231482 RepID=A0ABV3T2B1_9ACTN
MTTLALPIISTCSVDGCSYNHDHDCHAAAITVMHDSSACGTYYANGSKGGTDDVGHVGACQRADCVHNSMLECTAEGIEIGPATDTADCLTYAPR